ncbi:MAG: PQQ-dependent sugar dehydrogenase [Anaerolineae bacterium]|nr:PQQ-dependent sugar dehydrogenase [Gemmatimonadaceae bacterium]
MLVVGLMLSLSACSENDALSQRELPETGDVVLALDTVASGLSSPLYLTAPAGDARQFIVEQGGRILVVENGSVLSTPFLDIGSKITSGGERGLLSVAFHPRYASNGFFYVNYTDLSGDTRVERYRVSGNRNAADPTSAKLIITISQPFSNHNGGLVMFGPDGMLYIGMGDGGSGGDPQGHGQNRQSLLGKILRLNVDLGDPYSIPPDNPYVGGGGRPEIWANGMRNPWRFSFDRVGGFLYVADVGQNQWEEINAVASQSGGLNYGWNIAEGNHCYASSACDLSGLVRPVLEYGRSQGCSVTGGFVYRGTRMTALSGTYFYSDYCSGWLRSFRLVNGAATEAREWPVGDLGNVLSFGEDSAGELYVLSSSGHVYRLVPATTARARQNR